MSNKQGPQLNVVLKVISEIDEDSQGEYSLARGRTIKVDAVDISVLGLGITSVYSFPVGTLVEAAIDGDVFGLSEPMLVKAEIRFCKYTEKAKYRCGMRFVDMDPKYFEIIRDLIRKYERRKDPRIKLTD